MAKASKIGGLGKGLGALLPQTPEIDVSAVAGGAQMVLLEKISVNPYQPRLIFNEEKMMELIASIVEHGVVQPVLLRSVDGGFQLIAGERRVRAAREAGLEEIPALVRQMSDHEMMEVSLIENIQRQDLDPVEEARAYKRLSDEFGQTQEQIAKRISKSRSFIANSMRLLNLPEAILNDLAAGKLTTGHVRPLLTLDKADALRLAERIIKENATARDAELWAKEAAEPKSDVAKGQEDGAEEKAPKQLSVELKEIQRLLREAVNTKVEIVQSAKGGRVVIDYYTQDDIERILELLTGNRLLQ